MKTFLIVIAMVGLLLPSVNARGVQLNKRSGATPYDVCMLECEDELENCRNTANDNGDMQAYINCSKETCENDCVAKYHGK